MGRQAAASPRRRSVSRAEASVPTTHQPGALKAHWQQGAKDVEWKKRHRHNTASLPFAQRWLRRCWRLLWLAFSLMLERLLRLLAPLVTPRPRRGFDETPVPAPPDYSRAEAWAAYPGEPKL